MSVAATDGWPRKRLKYAVSLRRTRVDGADDERPYVGLEQIEAGTGRRPAEDRARLQPCAPAREWAIVARPTAPEAASTILSTR